MKGYEELCEAGEKNIFSQLWASFFLLQKEQFRIFQSVAVDVQSAKFLPFWLYLVSVTVQAHCSTFQEALSTWGSGSR